VSISATALAADTPSGWLNVKDFGASGSKFETTAKTEAGSKQIVVKNAGDFKVGQGVQISRAHVHYEKQRLWGPDYARGKALKDEVEIRGYDGTSGSWTAFLLEIHPEKPTSFRFTDDIGRSYSKFVPITGDWQPLSGGTEVKFNRREWDGAYLVTFSARDQLITTIEKIDGNTITLTDSANRSADDAVVQHNDRGTLQSAIDRAVEENKNLYMPRGRYRISGGLNVNGADGITIQGESAVGTIIDISMGEGTCLSLRGGRDVTLRDLRFEGHTGFANRDQCGNMNIRRVPAMWGMYLKGCNAVGIRNTTRVLVENCHAWHMATEAFYSQGRSRQGLKEPGEYTKEITYLRCSAIDCGRNAFNNNDLAENTSILNCRIVDVGGCSWEGASRFVKFVGNYVRNSGTVAMGNISSRAEHLEQLGSAQHIVADNVFESVVPYGGCAIRSAWGATQVVIRNNLFVNFGSSAVEVMGKGDDRHLPSANTTITGNIFDMTEIGQEPKPRTCVGILGAADTIISNNQMYVRGACDPQVTAIRLVEPAINLLVHDNLIRNCGTGLAADCSQGRVGEVIDPTTFVSGGGHVPMERRRSHRYRGYSLAWTSGGKVNGPVTVEEFDPDTLRFKLKQPAQLKPGDLYEVYPPSANWNIHDNTITGCQKPVVLDAFGSETSLLKDNVITRGEVSDVDAAVIVSGRFKLIGNCISSFDEPDSSVLLLNPDRFGKVCPNVIRDNIFQRCARVVKEDQQGAWKASHTNGNSFADCGDTPEQ